ncbi:hypothetical protein BGZ65_005526 [Modicella reniformis]|uniref:Uncharacterized protein n=1 Tax=Modicella reniformis TaxID=1440133 RepID=A0A9P6LRJ2_9FUNG|nr:hypothetical protein BGZ65_005526 [Modicella reniformis]
MQDTNATNIRADAMNACRLIDALISNPEWNRNIFTDSVQLFSDDILQEVRITTTSQLWEQQQQEDAFGSQQPSLQTIFLELQNALERIQQELSVALSQYYNLSSSDSSSSLPSTSLTLDSVMLDSLEGATRRLVQSLSSFEHLYQQEISPHVDKYLRLHSVSNLSERDTIPGIEETSVTISNCLVKK